MANDYKDIDKEELNKLAWEYVEHCLTSTKEVPTPRGPVSIKERHLPTVRYFLYIWLRQKHFDFYTKSNWYDAMKDSNHPLSDTIKNIDETFNALATDIVANEQKGIFYAKNKLGMSDKVESKSENSHQITGLAIEILGGDKPPRTKESDIPD